MREPSTSAMMVYVHMKRIVAKKTCPVCHCKYWVIGNPKIKGHFSPVCGKLKCYLAYYKEGGNYGVKRHYSVAKEL